MDHLIVCENISKIYRVGDMEVQALREIDLTIDRGEFLAVMGASGSGKSTLMNILGCLDQPTRGRYLLDGMDVGTAKQDVLAEIRNRHIGFVFQSFNLIPRTSALENAQLPLFYRGVSLREQRKQAATALQRVVLRRTGTALPLPTFRRPAATRGHCKSLGRGSFYSVRRRTHRQPRYCVEPGNYGYPDGTQS